MCQGEIIFYGKNLVRNEEIMDIQKSNFSYQIHHTHRVYYTKIFFQMQMHYSAKKEHMYKVNTQKSTQGALISNTLERVDITTL